MIQSLSSANLAMLPAVFFRPNPTLSIAVPLVSPGSAEFFCRRADARNLPDIVQVLHEFPAEALRRSLTRATSFPEVSIENCSYDGEDGKGKTSVRVDGRSWAIEMSKKAVEYGGGECLTTQFLGEDGRSILAKTLMRPGHAPGWLLSVTNIGRIFSISRRVKGRSDHDGIFQFMCVSPRVENDAIDRGLLTYLGGGMEMAAPSKAWRLFYRHFLKEGYKQPQDSRPEVLEDDRHCLTFSECAREITIQAKNLRDGIEIPRAVRKLLELDGNTLPIGSSS